MKPETYLIGYTNLDLDGIKKYLYDTQQEDFLLTLEQAEKEGLSSGEILCSFYAKLCYKSLVIGKNKNISRTRDIESNIKGCMDTGHGSVFEHCWLNFVTTNCSRVFTHELVRHRAGTAFSQTSGRYVAIDNLELILDPILEPASELIEKIRQDLETNLQDLRTQLIEDQNIKDFATKKKITSAIRRLAPNGQANEIGWSCNIRSLRHMLQMRTNRHAEWEIRLIFNQVADLVKGKFPTLLYGATEEKIDGLTEYGNLHI